MLEVREAERTRIARELHDELGQILTALKMDVELLSARIPRDRADLAEHVASMNRLLDSTVATTRRISSDLRPLVLDDLGLGAAAEWLLEGLAQRARIAYELKIDPSCAELGEPHASTLFRIMQESLTNVARHARATRVAVHLMREGDDAVLTIADNGVGMNADARARPGSFGLRGIRERVLLLGGVLNITSDPSTGTTVSARLPMPVTASPEQA
jgi:signal transduction histidine kinase